ncbi:MAG: long-chain-fatty-acid--CoA ligase [Actinomycetota bacterium]
MLFEHPAVAEAAVVGIPDDYLGEDVGAAIVLKPGAQVTAEELGEFVKDRVAAYEYPRIVWFEADGLPKGATGTILTRQIKPRA